MIYSSKVWGRSGLPFIALWCRSWLRGPLPYTPATQMPWMDQIIRLSGIAPQHADFNDLRAEIASMLLHLPPTASHVPQRYFARCLRKSVANRSAFDLIQDIKKSNKADAANEATQKTT